MVFIAFLVEGFFFAVVFLAFLPVVVLELRPFLGLGLSPEEASSAKNRALVDDIKRVKGRVQS